MMSELGNEPHSIVIGIDVGGGSIKTGLFLEDGRAVAMRRDTTPAGDPQGRALVTMITELIGWAHHTLRPAGFTPTALGIVMPGIMEDGTGIVDHAVNLGWHDLPLRDLLRTALDTAGYPLPLTLGHDVRAGALAESYPRAGDSPAHERIAFVPIGTGIACAVVDNGHVLGSGLAGEIGQLRIAHGPHLGKRLEEVASARAAALRAGVSNALELAERVRDGDVIAQRVWSETVEVLAEALSWIAVVSGATRIVVGGGLAESDDLLLAPLAARVAEHLAPLAPPEIVKARHGDTASARGAALLARSIGLPEPVSDPPAHTTPRRR